MKKRYGFIVAAAVLSAALMATGCGTDPGPVPSGPPATVPRAPEWTQTFDYSYQGNTATVTVSIGVPRKALNGLRNGSLELGTACEWNFDTDGAIPVTITFTNTTTGITGDGVVHWGVIAAGNDVSAELAYSESPSCASGADLASTLNSPGIRWFDLPPHVTGTEVAFVRVADFVSPDAPDGDLTKLRNVFIQLVNVQLGTSTLYAGGDAASVPKMAVLAPA